MSLCSLNLAFTCRNVVRFLNVTPQSSITKLVPSSLKNEQCWFFSLRKFATQTRHPDAQVSPGTCSVTNSNRLSSSDLHIPVDLPYARHSRRKFLKPSALRLQCLSKLLQCSVDKAKELTEQHQYLVYMNLELLEEKVKLLLSYGLTHAHVCYTPRMLYNLSYESLEQRLLVLKENSLLDMKYISHYLASKNTIFVQGVKLMQQEIAALEGFPSRHEYIQHRLGCSDTELDTFISNYPVRGMANSKTKKMLDLFLNEMGQSSDFVLRNKRLMMFSVERLRTRWKVMQVANIWKEWDMLRIWELRSTDFESKFEQYLNDIS